MKSAKIIRESFWNKITKSSAIVQQQQEFVHQDRLIKHSETFLKRLADCKSLLGLLDIHKELWMEGYRNKNLGPNEFGMFRTEYIPTMTSDEVFLGNVFGLFTFSISEWEKDHTTLFGSNNYGISSNDTNYEVVLRQYKNLLKSNIESIVKDASDYIYEYRKINS